MKTCSLLRSIVVASAVAGFGRVGAQEAVDLSGTVLGADGKPVQGVAVVLGESNLSDTTKADGTWKIQGDIVAVRPKLVSIRSMRWIGSSLVTQFDFPTLVQADLFDAAGRRLAALPSTLVEAGVQSISMDIPRFSGARWLRVVANGTPTVLSARSGVSAPGIALPRSLAARASENILIYSLQGQIITEDRLDRLIAANLLQYIKSYTISAKMVFDPRVKVDSVWAWFTGGTMTSPLRARMGFDDINQKVTGTVYTVRPKDAFATYSFRTWLNVMGNGNRFVAVSDTIKFTTDFGIIEWARGFNSSNAFPDGGIVSIDSVEVGTDLGLSVAMAWQDTANHRVKDSVIKAEWDLGDGKGWRLATRLPPTAKARWNNAGTDTVKLRLMDVDSNVAVITKAIKVVNSGAALKLGGPADTTITPSDTVAFRLTVRDTSGVARVIWSYGDGKSDTTTTGNVHEVKHAYPDHRVVGAGKDSTFALTVTVMDSLGGSSKHELARVKVVNTVLSGQLTYPEQPTWGALVNTEIPYQVTIQPANKRIAHAEWDLGDGQGWRDGSATGYQAKWLKPGSYAVQVRLTDKDSNAVTLTAASISISNTKSTATIASIDDVKFVKQHVIDKVITPADTVKIALTVSDVDGVAKVLWNFGDGIIDSTKGTHTLKHIYPGAADVPVNTGMLYTLEFQVIDLLGDTTSFESMAVIKDTNDVPKIVSFPDTFSYVDSTLRLVTRASDLGKIARYEWSTDGVKFSGTLASDTVFRMPDTTTSNYMVYVRGVDDDGNASKVDAIRTIVYGQIVDSRDNQKYKFIKIGTQTWMAENLNFAVDSSWWYNNSADSGAKYGRLYTWAGAMGLDDSCGVSNCDNQIQPRQQGACPEQWHVPERDEWDTLEAFVEADPRVEPLSALGYLNGFVLKNRSGWNTNPEGTDLFGFRAMPSGFMIRGDFRNGIHYPMNFNGAANQGYWWSIGWYSSSQYWRDDSRGGAIVQADNRKVSFGFAVRCIHN